MTRGYSPRWEADVEGDGSLGPVPVEKVLLAYPRGFCAGVEKAIKALAWMVRVFEPPVYCYHEIVHNAHVVERFRAQGVVFVDDVSEVPPGAPLMLSAHGTAPAVLDAAREQGRTVVDAVCPLVTKVHHELKVRAKKGYTVLYVGHEGHEEAVGTMAVAPSAVLLVQSEDDVDAAAEALDPDTPVALLAQTTLSHDEWSGIMRRAQDRFASLWMPNRSDLCFATTNRQAALKSIAGRADAVVVIGSSNSSNTRALEKVAHGAGYARVLRINNADELPGDLSGVVAVTAGASAPDELVQAVVDRLAPLSGVEEVRVTDEAEYFPPPPELRELARGLAALLSIGLGASGAAGGSGGSGDSNAPAGVDDEAKRVGNRSASGPEPDEEREAPSDPGPFSGDRDVSAADVLALLGG
jgi:4-hydroxy-3-methylbut-2-enyl diphosphate reductase